MFPEFLELKGYSGWILNGGAMACFMAGTAFGVMAGGHLADKFGARATLILSLGITFLTYQGFLLMPHVSSFTLALACFTAGLLMGAGQTLPISISQSMLPRNASMISGVMMGWSWAVGSLAPLLAACLAGKPSLGVIGALSIIGLLNLAAMGCTLCLRKTEPSHTQALEVSNI